MFFELLLIEKNILTEDDFDVILIMVRTYFRRPEAAEETHKIIDLYEISGGLLWFMIFIYFTDLLNLPSERPISSLETCLLRTSHIRFWTLEFPYWKSKQVTLRISCQIWVALVLCGNGFRDLFESNINGSELMKQFCGYTRFISKDILNSLELWRSPSLLTWTRCRALITVPFSLMVLIFRQKHQESSQASQLMQNIPIVLSPQLIAQKPSISFIILRLIDLAINDKFSEREAIIVRKYHEESLEKLIFL